MAIVHQTDKRSGITYAYESVSFWDKEKKQSRSKRTLVGRVDSDGNIIPTDGRGKKRSDEKRKVGRPTITIAQRKFYGATYLLDAIGETLGLRADLEKVFGDTYTKQILSLAYFMILEDNTPMYRFEKWDQLHKHPFDKSISSQRSSELFGNIKESHKHQFFTLQGKRRVEDEYWAYDTTSISSYSQSLKQVQYGYNKEDDPLAQINLALVFGEKSNLPFYYRKLPGNITDIKTLKTLLHHLGTLGLGKVKLVMDKGFYSKANIDALYLDHKKFLLCASMKLKLIQEHLEALKSSLVDFQNYNKEYELYTKTITTTWDLIQTRGYKKDTINHTKRIYIHYYYDIEKAANLQKEFDTRLMILKEEIESNNLQTHNQKLYEKYFTITQTPKKGNKATINTSVVEEIKKNFGYFALLSNETIDSITALRIYREKDFVEKAFGNLKEKLGGRRMLVSSEQSLEGKLFVQFVALIFLSYIKKEMQTHKLFSKYTLQGLLDQLDLIEIYEYPGSSPQVSELTTKQKEIYNVFGIKLPDSSL